MKTKKKYDWAIISGGFDPIHGGHIKLLEDASNLADKICVILNSDEWLISKKGRYFMNQLERKIIIQNLSFVDQVIEQSNEKDQSSINGIIEFMKNHKNERVCFCNGGDRNSKEDIKEAEICKRFNITMEFGVGGSSKINSSSVLLSDYNNNKFKRPWGYFEILSEGQGYKIKKIIINPNESLSTQIHEKRHEKWIIVEGVGKMLLDKKEFSVKEGDFIAIDLNQIHSVQNTGEGKLSILELQKGSYLGEDDIKRLKDKYGREKLE